MEGTSRYDTTIKLYVAVKYTDVTSDLILVNTTLSRLSNNPVITNTLYRHLSDNATPSFIVVER